MSKIDWTKPLRTNVSHCQVRAAVHPHGNRVIAYWYNSAGEWSEGVFDKFTGAVLYTEFAGKRDRGTVMIENVPEEPKDHIRLFKTSNGWYVDNNSGSQLQTKSFWENPLNGAYPGVVVKVPV